MLNFDEVVCGCSYCFFDKTTSKCSGQCPNTFLQTCVSKIPIPSTDSDCACAQCSAQWVTEEIEDTYYDNGRQFPSCEAGTCLGDNSCTPMYVSRNRRLVNDTLFCQCNND